MTKATRNGLVLAVAQVALVASLGGKLLADRATYPRVWIQTAPVDPRLPIRGRYVRLRVDASIGPDLTLLPAQRYVDGTGRAWMPEAPPQAVQLAVEDDRLVAHASSDIEAVRAHAAVRDGRTVAQLIDPLAYFIPERVPDPSRRPPGETLWVEVTVPRRGPPRPIRLGVMKDGVLEPIVYAGSVSPN